MAIRGTTVSVGTAGTLLTQGSGGGGPSVVGQHGAIVTALGTAGTIFLSGSASPTSSNFRLVAGATVALNSLGVDDVLYGASDSGTISVSVLEVD